MRHVIQYALAVVDLTNEAAASEKEQLQAAIEQSLRDNQPGNILGGQISREEQDISRSVTCTPGDKNMVFVSMEETV